MQLALRWWMYFAKVGLGLWVVAAGLFATVACSDDDASNPPDDSRAGNGGKNAGGGSGGKNAGGGQTGGKSGASAGAGGASAGAGGEMCSVFDDCTEVDHCGPYPITDLCSQKGSQCPASSRIIAERGWCGFAETATQYDTTCDGHVVVAEFGTHTVTWGFDQNGTFNYELFDNDVAGNCKDGKTASNSRVWGETPCDPAGNATPFNCDPGAGGAGGAGGQGGVGGQGR